MNAMTSSITAKNYSLLSTAITSSSVSSKENCISEGLTPNVSVSVKRLYLDNKRTGRKRYEYGVVFEVDGCLYPLAFGSKEQTLLYIALLLRHKVGRFVARNEFKYSLKMQSFFLSRDAALHQEKQETLDWLEDLYRTLFPMASVDFCVWYDRLKGNSCHAISQAKSRINAKIIETLKSLPQELVSKLLVQKQGVGVACSAYTMDLPSAHIHLADSLEGLLPSSLLADKG